jgi:hypothetical protein
VNALIAVGLLSIDLLFINVEANEHRESTYQIIYCIMQPYLLTKINVFLLQLKYTKSLKGVFLGKTDSSRIFI